MDRTTRTSLPVVAELSDEEVCRRVVQGERELFAVVVDRYKQTVFRLTVRALGNRHDAEELSQEIFLRAFRALEQFEGRAHLGTWLTRIALNQINSHFSSRHHRIKSRCDLFDPEQHGAASSADSLERGALVERTLAGLEHLTPIYRDILILCGLGGRSYEEAAAICGIPVGTVRSRLNAARLELRRVLEGEDQ